MPNINNIVQFKYGLQANFDMLEKKDINTIYFTTDEQRLFVGNLEFTRPIQKGVILPTGFQPPYSLFFKTDTKELYYSNGTEWAACSNLYVHPTSGVTAGGYGDNADTALAFGGTFKVPSFTVDENGHLTIASDTTLTLPTETKLAKGEDTSKTASPAAGTTFKAVTGFTVNDHTITAEVTTFTLPNDNDTTYTFEEGTENGTIRVTPIGGEAIAVKVKGLDAAAYKGVVTTIDDSVNLPTSDAVNKAINAAISSVTQFDVQVVTSLPDTGEKGIIYLIAHAHGDTDSYDEYIWNTATEPAAFEKIGNTDVNLSEYIKTADAEAKFIAKVTGQAGQVAKFKEDGSIESTGFTLGTNVPADSKFTDDKVKQAAATDIAGEYPVILGGTTGTTEITDIVNKAAEFTYNPSTKSLTVTSVKGTSDKAISDEDGNNIKATYATKSEITAATLVWAAF